MKRPMENRRNCGGSVERLNVFSFHKNTETLMRTNSHYRVSSRQTASVTQLKNTRCVNYNS